MILALLIIPFTAGILSFMLRCDCLRRLLLVSASFAHMVLTLCIVFFSLPAQLGGWFALDPLGKVFLLISSVLFFAASLYAVGYLRLEGESGRDKNNVREEEGILSNAPDAVFIGCLLFFLFTMTLVIVSQHFGVLWVGMEATTLVTAPLIYFHRHQRSLEATWKYLLVCSVGIALALLGNLFLAVSGSYGGGQHVPLLISDFVRQARFLHFPWLKVAFLFLFVGYGTKMGLAPFHTWLPDAHSEAPSVISALLSGALLNCAFLSILRIHQVCVAAGIGAFSQDIFIVFGIISMFFAALFILGQTDYKRMLAYSSIEHMGILCLGIGIGKIAIFGSLFHAINHSLVKAMLFFTAGNILHNFRTKSIGEVKGVIDVLPFSGILWMAGFFAITGTPPFGTFLSELIILKGAFDARHSVIAVLYLILLAVIFMGMAHIFLSMAQGKSKLKLSDTRQKQTGLVILPAVFLGMISLFLGMYMPKALQDVLTQAVCMLGGS